MEVSSIYFRPNPSLPSSSSKFSFNKQPNPFHFKSLPLHLKLRTKSTRRSLVISASSSGDGNGPDSTQWERIAHSIRQGSARFWSNFENLLKKETGFDIGEANVKVVGGIGDIRSKGGVVFDRFRFEMLPQFIHWNAWERWKDIKNWDPKRIVALVFYMFVVVTSSQKMYMVFRNVRQDHLSKEELTEAYMESLIPEPTPSNIRKFKKSLWRKTMPKGLKMRKYNEEPSGALIRDHSYVGEDAWDDDPGSSQENMKQGTENDVGLNPEEKKESKGVVSVSGSTD